ncbi:hypothetical protein ZIOFF_070224 [Zingiber officinale]|uniref:Translation initiation factor IF2/IF5 domain-containing protein n=1 Tax=Zingiber officinale TaxID=94328 RepID=A0A8J5EDF7_ZINOF|nr:hypothetical protein ZIOFF_070224 [Zingiber officinale]
MSNENPTEMKEEVPELAPFDPTKKKKKKKVAIQDPAEEVEKLAEKTESLAVDEISGPSFVGMRKKKKKPVETNFLNEDDGDAGEEPNGDQIGEDELGEGIVLGVVQYPWEGTDRDYKYEEQQKLFHRPLKRCSIVDHPVARMHRQPEHVMNFLLAEMGTSGSLDGQQRLVIKGRFAPKNFEGILRRYISKLTTQIPSTAVLFLVEPGLLNFELFKHQ